MEKVLTLLPKYFPFSELRLEGHEYLLYDENDECFLGFELDKSHFFVKDLVKTKIYSGKEVLSLIELLCKEIPEIKDIIIESDSSSLILNGFKINLLILSILYKGETYYTSLGYFDETYFEDKEQWEIIRGLKFDEIISISFNDYINFSNDEDNPIGKYNIYHVLKTYSEMNNLSITNDKSFKMVVDLHCLFIVNLWNELYPEYIFDTLEMKEIGIIIYNKLKYQCSNIEYKLFQLILNYTSLVLPTSFEWYTKRVNI